MLKDSSTFYHQGESNETRQEGQCNAVYIKTPCVHESATKDPHSHIKDFIPYESLAYQITKVIMLIPG